MLLNIDNLSKTFQLPDKKVNVLSNINLTVAEGELVAIVGASGSGKSTLLGIAAGLDKPSSGSITLCGDDLNTLDEDALAKLRNEKLGFVFQAFQLLPTLTALENVLLPLELLGIKAGDAERAKALLEGVGLAERLDHYPIQMSGGEQQRVALARAFINQPKVLFADEPTGNLDAETSEKIVEQMFALNDEYNTTLILVTHDQELAERCDRIINLKAGKILEEVNNT